MVTQWSLMFAKLAKVWLQCKDPLLRRNHATPWYRSKSLRPMTTLEGHRSAQRNLRSQIVSQAGTSAPQRTPSVVRILETARRVSRRIRRGAKVLEDPSRTMYHRKSCRRPLQRPSWNLNYLSIKVVSPWRRSRR